MVEILRSKDQTGPLWWRFSSAIVALYSLVQTVPSQRVSESVATKVCLVQYNMTRQDWRGHNNPEPIRFRVIFNMLKCPSFSSLFSEENHCAFKIVHDES